MSEAMAVRAGRYIQQPTGYRAFIPVPLPPDPFLIFDTEMMSLLSSADRAIGRLDAATELLPNPDLFVAMYVRKEAVLSSQIEGTQASLDDLLEYEAKQVRRGKTVDVNEIVNYVEAMNYGLVRLESMPMSIRLMKEIHAKLLCGNVRGCEREPGELRRSQNWIGPDGCTLANATFVPPPPHEVLPALGALEQYMHEDTHTPPLIACGLAHAQFETIHPFLDGNGRMGRLLITFLLCWKGTLKRPLLYLSAFLKKNRSEYYDRLQAVRDHGDWEGWMKFFLRGVQEVSREAAETAREIQRLREGHRQLIMDEIQGTATGFILLDYLFMRPVVNVNQVMEVIQKSYTMANNLVARFERLGILNETTGNKRNRIYSYDPYIALMR